MSKCNFTNYYTLEDLKDIISRYNDSGNVTLVEGIIRDSYCPVSCDFRNCARRWHDGIRIMYK